jgi:predicted Zn-dependent peptidase
MSRRQPLAVLLFALMLSAPPSLAAPIVRTLPNGLRVVVFPRPQLPIVQVQLEVPAGLLAEPRDRAGLAYLTAQMVRQGTTSRSTDDFTTELDTLGATLAISVTRDAALVAAGSGVAEFESVLELVSDAVVNPLFSEEAFQVVRRQIAGELGAQAQSPAALADERANLLAFPEHPYAHPTRGSIARLLEATRDQVRDFHRDHWRPDQAVLAIAGDVDPERAFASVTEWFGRWGGKAAPAPKPAAPSARAGVFVSDLSGSPVTEIRALLRGPGRGDAGYPGWMVLREALESGLLPPGVHSSLSPGRDASLLLVSAAARPESAAVLAGRVRASLRSLASAPPAGPALEAARKRAAQGWMMSLETLGQQLSSWLAGDAAGLPGDHLAGQPALIRSAAPPAFGPEAVTLLLAGPLARMKGSLAQLGRVDTLGLEDELEATRAAAASPEQRKRGKQLVAAAIAAHGGQAKLDQVKRSEAAGELRMMIGGRDLAGESRYLRVDPQRLVYTTRFLDLDHRQVLDGSRGWALSSVGDSATLVNSDSSALVGLRAILESDLIHLLRAANGPTGDPAATGRVELDGKPCDLVEFTNRFGGRTRLSLDATTHRVVSVEDQPTPQGTWRDRRRWSEYVQLEGIWWPRQEVREVDGEQVSKTILRRIVVNGDVDSTLFRRPIVARGQVRGLE